MTLCTHIKLDSYMDIDELRDWINTNLLNAPDAIPDPNNKPGVRASNQLGQGLDAWLMIHAKNGEVMENVPYDPEDEEELEWLSKEPEGFVEIDFDTAYGYSKNGLGCAHLHAAYIMFLEREFLTPRGIGLWWQNEFTGEWFQGVNQEDIEAFVGGGVNAQNWFQNTVLPAIESGILSGSLSEG